MIYAESDALLLRHVIKLLLVRQVNYTLDINVFFRIILSEVYTFIVLLVLLFHSLFMGLPIIQKKEHEKLTQAHNDFVEVLTYYTLLRVHNKSLSEDLVQETFLKTWKYLLKGGEVVMMKAFLYHVLNGLIIDEYRKQKYMQYSLDFLQENGFDIQTDEHTRTNKGESVDIKVVQECIAELPDKYREIVRMRLILDMSLEEIAKICKKPKNLLAVQIHRGIKIIQRLYRKKTHNSI
jgi:RNA polymerase sigma-70 factor (ECF subfamily)